MTIYRGRRVRGNYIIERRDESQKRWSNLSPRKSLKLWNHSPTGFAWGYAGSGPAQAALALLLDHAGNRDLALNFYQDFKFDVIARLSDEWEMTGNQISEAIAAIKQKRVDEEAVTWLGK